MKFSTLPHLFAILLGIHLTEALFFSFGWDNYGHKAKGVAGHGHDHQHQQQGWASAPPKKVHKPKVIIRENIHIHHTHVHHIHRNTLNRHRLNVHNHHKHNEHVVIQPEQIVHEYNKAVHKVVPSVKETYSIIPNHEAVHTVQEHVVKSPPVVVRHEGWGEPSHSSGWEGYHK